MVLEYEDEILIIDCGFMFSDLENFGVEFVIPDFSYLKERKDKIKAFVLTHGHEDHIGALAFALKSGLRAPIYASAFCSLLVRERMKEHGLESGLDLRTFKMGQSFGFKHFQVETVSVNHSIVDSAALVISTPVGQVIHTGDFRIDPTPFLGSMIDLERFKRAGDEGVLLLLSDSTNVERHEHGTSESNILKQFEMLLAAAEGLTVVSMFASNVARMGQVLKVAKQLGKKVALSGRSMEQNIRLGGELGYLSDWTSVIIPLADLDQHPRDQVVVLSTGSQGESRSGLIRMAFGEHSQVKLMPGDTVLMSSKFIPGNEKSIGRMINQLFKQGAQVLYESVHDIHVSGHATRPELEKMLRLTRPKFFMPIHGEYRHLVHHAKLGKEVGLPEDRILIAVNGDVVQVEPDSIKIVDHLDEPRILVEGRQGNDITKLVLRDRRQIGEKGVVFSLVVRNRETRRIVSGPEIIAKGLVNDSMEGWLLEESKKVVGRVIDDYDSQIGNGKLEMDLQETIRIELRRFFNSNIGKKPVVLSIILDL